MKNVTMYIKPTCPFCKRALQLLKREGVTPTVVDITNNNELRNLMVAKTKRTSVPQIFIGESHLGGCDDLVAAQKSGQFREMIK